MKQRVTNTRLLEPLTEATTDSEDVYGWVLTLAGVCLVTGKIKRCIYIFGFLRAVTCTMLGVLPNILPVAEKGCALFMPSVRACVSKQLPLRLPLCLPQPGKHQCSPAKGPQECPRHCRLESVGAEVHLKEYALLGSVFWYDDRHPHACHFGGDSDSQSETWSLPTEKGLRETLQHGHLSSSQERPANQLVCM